MLLVSFLVLEIVFAMVPAEVQTSDDLESQAMVSVAQQTGGAPDPPATRILDSLILFQDSPLGKVRGMRHHLANMDAIVAVLATLLHTIVLLWTLHQLWRSGFDFTGCTSEENGSWLWLLIIPVMMLLGFLVLMVGAFIISIPIIIVCVLLKELSPLLAIIIALPMGFGGFAFMVLGGEKVGVLLGWSPVEKLTSWVYQIITLFLVLHLLYGVCWEFFAIQPLRMKFGLLSGERANPRFRDYLLKHEDNEVIAVGAFLGFVATLVLCVVWYQARFDPAGTCKPVFADVFG